MRMFFARMFIFIPTWLRRSVPRRYWVFFKMKLTNGNWIRHLSGFQLLHKIECSEGYYGLAEWFYRSLPWDQRPHEKQLYFVVYDMFTFLRTSFVRLAIQIHKSKTFLLWTWFLMKVKHRFLNNSAQLLITISKRGVCNWPHLPF